jgi:chromosomal replication initiator protein
MNNQLIELSQLWSRILDKIKERMDEAKVFDAFLSDSYLNSIESNIMVVVVNSSLAVTLLTTKYIDLIDSAVRECTETDYKVKFVEEKDATKAAEKIVKKPAFFNDLYINPKLTFDSFVVGPSNREASQAALMIASNPGKMYNPLFLYSQSGLGKTHLLHAIGNYIKENTPTKKVLYLPAQEFFDEYVKYVRGEQEGEDLKSYFKNNVDVLLLDDIQYLSGKHGSSDMFFTIFSGMINVGKQVIIASDKHPNELQDLEARLVSRFNAGLTVNIKAPDYDTCVEILRKKIKALGLDITSFDPQVLNFFAEKFSRNVRDLEGALNRLIFYTTSVKQTSYITLDIAMEAVQNEIDVSETKIKLSETKIINVVADYYNLSTYQLTGKARPNQVTLPRHIAMYLIRTMLDVSYAKIGQMFGGKDHSTVINGVEKVDKALKTDTALQAAISELKKRLK